MNTIDWTLQSILDAQAGKAYDVVHLGGPSYDHSWRVSVMNNEHVAELLKQLSVELRSVLDRLVSKRSDQEALLTLSDSSEVALARVEVGALEYVLSCGPAPPTRAKLTPREREVVLLVKKGLPNKAIAAKLGLACSTVSAYLRRIFRKLGVNSRVLLAQHNLIPD